MSPESVSLASVALGATAFAGLWTLEAVFPLVRHTREHDSLGRRARNLAMAGINAGVAALGFGALLSLTLEFGRAHGIGPLHWLRPAAWAAGDAAGPAAGVAARVLTFALAFCVLDLWHYAFHVLAHKVPALWRFHVVHHNDPHVDVTTANRFHFGEVAIQQALSLPLYLLLGVGVFELLVYNAVLVPVALFHHANVRVPPRVDRLLSALIVTPSMHFVHHSKWVEETDSNFSAVLSVWDRLFRTYRRRPVEEIDFGLGGYEERDYATLRGMLATPLERAKATLGEPGGRAGGGAPRPDAPGAEVEAKAAVPTPAARSRA